MCYERKKKKENCNSKRNKSFLYAQDTVLFFALACNVGQVMIAILILVSNGPTYLVLKRKL